MQMIITAAMTDVGSAWPKAGGAERRGARRRPFVAEGAEVHPLARAQVMQLSNPLIQPSPSFVNSAE